MIKQCINLGVGGLGLPDQDYYISEEKRYKRKRAVREHIARMLQFMRLSSS
jgi:predicted metalloendopeptidase